MFYLLVVCLVVALSALYRSWRDHELFVRRNELLNRSLEQSRKLIEWRSRLASEVAHEIKNPLTAILCSAETLNILIGDKIDPDQRKSLLYIREYGDILLRLVSDFLDLSRAEDGEMKVKAEPTELLPAIRSIVGLLKAQALQKEIGIKLLHERENPVAVIDSRHVKQVIFNLVYNAIKYTPQGGEIEILVQPLAENNELVVVVSDNGPGISKNKLNDIFDLYSRYEDDGAMERSGPLGTGIGLALCKKLIEFCGGKIWVESETGVGSKFCFSVPRYKSSSVSNCNQLLPDDPHPLLGLSFLIIDEDMGSRESVARLIQAWGGVVDRVSEAVDALSALENKSYDAIMIDDELAGATSNLAQIIKNQASEKKATVIVAGREPNLKELALSRGADVYIEKPFNSTALLQSLINTHDQH